MTEPIRHVIENGMYAALWIFAGAMTIGIGIGVAKLLERRFKPPARPRPDHLDTMCLCCFGQDEPNDHCLKCNGTGVVPRRPPIDEFIAKIDRDLVERRARRN